MTRVLAIEGSGKLWGLSARFLICSMPYNGRMSTLVGAFLWRLAWKRFARLGRGRSSQNGRRGGARTTVNVLPTGASLLPDYGGPAFSVSRWLWSGRSRGRGCESRAWKIEGSFRERPVDESVTHFG
jgi:hypothetical protein